MNTVDIIGYVTTETDADGTYAVHSDASGVVRLFTRWQRASLADIETYGAPWVYGIRRDGTLTAPMTPWVTDASDSPSVVSALGKLSVHAGGKVYRVEIRHPDGVRVSGVAYLDPYGVTTIVHEPYTF